MRPKPGLAAAVLLLALSAGRTFAGSPLDKSEKAASGFLKLEKNLGSAKEQLDAILKSLNDVIAPGGNVVSEYEAFAKDAKKTRDIHKKTKSSAAAAHKRREKYVDAWGDDLKKIQNPELRQASESRRDELQPSIDRVRDHLESAGERMQPFLQAMSDLELYLANNLSPAGIVSAEPLAKKANSDGRKLQNDLDNALNTLKSLRERITPGGN